MTHQQILTTIEKMKKSLKTESQIIKSIMFDSGRKLTSMLAIRFVILNIIFLNLSSCYILYATYFFSVKPMKDAFEMSVYQQEQLCVALKHKFMTKKTINVFPHQSASVTLSLKNVLMKFVSI